MRVEFNFEFDQKNKVKSITDKGLVQLRAYHLGKRRYFTTDIKIIKEQWDYSKQRVIKHFDANNLNDRLESLLEQLQKAQRKAEFENEIFGLDTVKTIINKQEVKTEFFNVFALNETNSNNKIKLVTKRSKRNTLNKLLKYNNDKNILFSELTFTFCNGFINHLTGLKLDQSTIQKNYKNCKSMVEDAIKHGFYSKRNPFKDIQVKVIDKPVQALLPEQLEAIEKLTFETYETRLETIRDMFLFSCYTGLRVSDLIKLNKSQLKQTDKGLALTYTAQKTGKHGEIPLHALFPLKDEKTTKPIKLIHKYISEDKDLIFKKYSDQLYNRELKTIQHLAKIDFKLTSHAGRKTFGTTLARLGVSAFVIKELLQHNNLKTTERYVNTTQNRIVDECESGSW